MSFASIILPTHHRLETWKRKDRLEAVFTGDTIENLMLAPTYSAP